MTSHPSTLLPMSFFEYSQGHTRLTSGRTLEELASVARFKNQQPIIPSPVVEFAILKHMRYVALLRGIGPGNPNMTGEKLRSFFEDLGFADVRTVLASGNVIFSSPSGDTNALTERIEGALPQKLGFHRSVILRSELELQNLIDLDPFRGIEQSHNKEMYLLITFFRAKPDISLKLPYKPDDKPFTLLGRIDNAVYGSVDLTHSKTPDYMAWLEKQFGKGITSRTPKTIRLILSRMRKT